MILKQTLAKMIEVTNLQIFCDFQYHRWLLLSSIKFSVVPCGFEISACTFQTLHYFCEISRKSFRKMSKILVRLESRSLNIRKFYPPSVRTDIYRNYPLGAPDYHSIRWSIYEYVFIAPVLQCYTVMICSLQDWITFWRARFEAKILQISFSFAI